MTLTYAQLVGNDTDPDLADGDVLAVNSVWAPAGATVVNNAASKTVTYTPAPDHLGPASFVYRVKDAAGTTSANVATVSVTVTPAVNSAPTAVNDGPFTVRQGESLTLTYAQLVGNDTDPDGDVLAVNSVWAPAGASVINNASARTVTYTPAANYTGPASFVYRVKDAAGTTSANVATVSVTVTANAAPVVNTQVGEADRYNGIVEGTITATDADFDDLTYTVSTPTAGRVVLDTHGNFTYTPFADARAAAGVAGSQANQVDSFTITVDDGHGQPTVVTVGVDISPTTVGRVITVSGSPYSIALSPDGNRAYVANGDSISIIDTDANTEIATLPGFDNPYLTVSPDGSHAYIIDSGLYSRVSVLDTATSSVVAQLNPEGGYARAAVFSADSSRAYIQTSSAVSIVDTSTSTIVATVEGELYANRLVVVPGGDKIYGVRYGGGEDAGRLLIIDSATDEVTTAEVSGADIAGLDVFFPSQDGSRLYFVEYSGYNGGFYGDEGSFVTVVDTTNYSATKTPLSLGAEVVVDAAGERLRLVTSADPFPAYRWVAVIDDDTGAITNVVDFDSYATAVAPGNASVYFGALEFDTLTGKVVSTIPGEYWDGVAAKGSDGRVYLADGEHRTVTVLHPDPVDIVDQLAATVTLGGLGRVNDMAVAPGASTVWILSEDYYRDSDGNGHRYDMLTEFDPNQPEQITRTVLDTYGWYDLAVGHDGGVYLGGDYNSNIGQVGVFDPTDRSITLIDIENQDDYRRDMLIGDDGRIYVISLGTTTILAADNSVEATLPVGGTKGALGPDGRIYLNQGSKINPDNTFQESGYGYFYAAARDDSGRLWTNSAVYDMGSWPDFADNIPTKRVWNGVGGYVTIPGVGGNPQDIAVGSNGFVYVADWDVGLTVIDPTEYRTRHTYSMGNIDGIDYPTRVVTTADGHVFVATYGYTSEGDPNDTVTVIAPKTASTPTTPVHIDTTYVPLGSGPTSVKSLWDNVFNIGELTDGVSTQTVRDQDGTNRLIVYIGGTTDEFGLDPGDNQGIVENAISRLGVPKSDQIDAVNDALDKCSAHTACGSIGEIMVVGYSQGGMDAQNLAFWNLFSAPVTTVVTFGSPIITADFDSKTIHIQDTLDGIVGLEDTVTAALPLPPFLKVILQGIKAAADLRGQVYSQRSGTPVDSPLPWFGVHSNFSTYATLSDWFWATPANQYADQKAAIGRFINGELIDQWPYTGTTAPPASQT